MGRALCVPPPDPVVYEAVDWNPHGPIALIGTLDTKGTEALFLKQRLAALGFETVVIDVGVLGPPAFTPDVSRDEIAGCTGASVHDLAGGRDRGRAVAAMQAGLAVWVRERHARSPLAGVLAIGGSAGTSIATAGMRELPAGVPKLMVSTVASGNTRPYVGPSDIAMLYSVADFSGLNRLTRRILANAANGLAGMCGLPGLAADAQPRPLLAATMFGVTTPCVNRVRELLERRGFELLIFHATGTGGQAMEQLIRDGVISGVLDITTTELADELVGGVLSAGPHRLEAAGRLGIPQVISTGALDMVNFGALDTVPEKFRARKLCRHNPAVTLMRTTTEENARLGEVLAVKANAAAGPVTIVLPLRGVSAIDAEGEPFHNPAADAALVEAIRHNLDPKVKLVEMDSHINDPEFAARLTAEFLEVLERSATRVDA
jgi:uncharacterized protein (UPF0261 family)